MCHKPAKSSYSDCLSDGWPACQPRAGRDLFGRGIGHSHAPLVNDRTMEPSRALDRDRGGTPVGILGLRLHVAVYNFKNKTKTFLNANGIEG